MTSLNLNIVEKRDIQIFLGNIQNSKQHEINNFAINFARGNETAWHRFIKGAYNHPITWWIGIIQLQMQMGIWGFQEKSRAQTRASLLWQVSKPIRDELAGLAGDNSTPILEAFVKYNLKHRKADIIGRFTGGIFTNYASTGGRFGNKRLPSNAKKVRTITNLGIASYGAAIKAIAQGMNTYQAVIQSILTGRPEQISIEIQTSIQNSLSSEEIDLLGSITVSVSEAFPLAQMSPPPVPVKEFCLRPENINLKEICR